MILLASDWVGLRITEYLVDRRQPIDCLVLDEGDRGQCNASIRRAFAHAAGPARIETSQALKDTDFLVELAKSKPPLGVLAWWPHLLNGPLLEIPKLGWLNLHPGYLPYNRGKHPNFWCLVDETPCGVALHFIDRGIDTGPVVARAQLDTTWTDTGESVHRKCRQLAVQLFRDSFERVIGGSARPVAQGASDGTSHRAADIEEASEIDLDRTYTARQLLNIIRARTFPPHPTAFFRAGSKKYSVRVVIEETPS